MTPELVTAADERQRCCVLDDVTGARCPNATDYWVGTNGIDDYTHVCKGHLDSVRRPEDTVVPIAQA